MSDAGSAASGGGDGGGSSGERSPSAGRGAGNPSTLSDLEWADVLRDDSRSRHDRPPPPRPLQRTPSDASTVSSRSSCASRSGRSESSRTMRRGPAAGGVGGGDDDDDDDDAAVRARRWYKEAARKTTGVGVSVRNLTSESSSPSTTEFESFSSSLSRPRGDGDVVESSPRGTGAGVVKISKAARRLSVGCAGESSEGDGMENMDEVAFAHPEGEIDFERPEDDGGAETGRDVGKGVGVRRGEKDEIEGVHDGSDDTDSCSEDLSRLSASNGRERHYYVCEDSRAMEEFSLSLRKIQGRACPHCGYFDCRDCRRCRSCCSSAAASDREPRLVLGVLAAAAALVVALSALLSRSGASDSAPTALSAVYLPAYFETNLADRAGYAALDSSAGASDAASPGDVPLLWTAPLSASALMRDVFGRCYGLVQASEVGIASGHDRDETLRVVDVHGLSFVNVDVATPEGLERAARLDLAGSGAADVVSTSLLHGVVSAVFDPAHRGRLMAVFRHPVERVAAEYRLIREGEFASTFLDVANMTLTEYAASEYAGDNWVTRHLVFGDDPDADRELTELELVLAKEILRRKAIVGLYDDLSGAASHFASAFGFDSGSDEAEVADARACVGGLVDGHLERDTSLPSLEEDGDEWNAILERNRYDVALYEYAKELYRYQVAMHAR